MNKNYKFKETINDRYAVWEQKFDKAEGNKIGVYKIYDLYKSSRTAKFAFRYKPRKGQTQEESDRAIITNATMNFYKKKPIYFNRGDRSSTQD